MITSSYAPYVCQHMGHLCDWDDDKAKVLNENAHVCAVTADAHVLWKDAMASIECDKWARAGISGVDTEWAYASGATVNMRQRLAGKAFDADILLDRGGPIAVGDATYIKPITIGDHWVIDPDYAEKWAEILVAELDPLLSDGPYSGLFLDKYGDLPYFLVQNGITPTQQDADDWRGFLRHVIRTISKECGKWGVELFVNGGVEENYQQAITGPMFENVPNEATWSDHFHEIMDAAKTYGRKGVIVGENGGRYRREGLALSMLFDCYFSPRTAPSEPLGIPIADAKVVGEWFPCENRPVKPVEPRVWRRKFWNPREHAKRVCEMKFEADWRTVEVTLPWDK